jgi:hypothetical protein
MSKSGFGALRTLEKVLHIIDEQLVDRRLILPNFTRLLSVPKSAPVIQVDKSLVQMPSIGLRNPFALEVEGLLRVRPIGGQIPAWPERGSACMPL